MYAVESVWYEFVLGRVFRCGRIIRSPVIISRTCYSPVEKSQVARQATGYERYYPNPFGAHLHLLATAHHSQGTEHGPFALVGGQFGQLNVHAQGSSRGNGETRHCLYRHGGNRCSSTETGKCTELTQSCLLSRVNPSPCLLLDARPGHLTLLRLPRLL